MITYNEYIISIDERQTNELIEAIDVIINESLASSTSVLQLLEEGILDKVSSYVKDKINFIKDLAEKLNIGLINLLKVFKNKKLIDFFKSIKWDMKSLIKIVQNGYKLWSQLHKIIAKYIADNKIVKFTEKELKKLDDFLMKHPLIKKTAGLLVAGFLIYQWTQMVSFTADIEFDFDQTMLFLALRGTYSLAQIFASEDGIHMLMFIATGVLTGITFPYPGPTWVLFAASIVYTLTKDKQPQIAASIVKNAKKFKKFTKL